MARSSGPEDAVLFAFRQAYAEGRYEVAEHLLKALESIAEVEDYGPLFEAYRLLDHAPKSQS